MNSIIRDFYEGNLCPSNQIGPALRRFRKEWECKIKCVS